MNTIKNTLKQTSLYPWYRAVQSELSYITWNVGGKNGSTPHKVKELEVVSVAKKYNLKTLVETGTYLGDMIAAVKNDFTAVYSIEINEVLAKNAQKKFANSPHVQILIGDSGIVMKDLLPKLSDNVLFWLDGHFSGGITGRGVMDSPIIQELDAIFKSPLTTICILIDDARLFVGTDGYPTIKELEAFVAERKPGWKCEVLYDIIRIYA